MTQIRLIKANKIQTWDFGLSQWFILRSTFHLCPVGVSGREAPDSTDTPCTTGESVPESGGEAGETLRRQSWESGKPKTGRVHKAEERAIWRLGRHAKICRGSRLESSAGNKSMHSY